MIRLSTINSAWPTLVTVRSFDWPAYPGAPGRVWGDTVGAFAKPPYQLSERANAWLRAHASDPRRSTPERAASAITRALEGIARHGYRLLTGRATS